MSDLDEFFKMMADGKKSDPVAVKSRAIKEHIKGDLGSLFSEISTVKAQDPKVIKAKKVEKQIDVIEQQVKETVQNDLSSLFSELSALRNKKETLIEQHPNVVDLPIAEDITVEDMSALINQTPAPVAEEPFKDVKKYLGKGVHTTHIDPDISPVAQEFKAITDKIRLLEQSITKIVNTGPGSGEVNLRYLDDVDRSSISDSRLLSYSAATKKFIFIDNTNDNTLTLINGASRLIQTQRIMAQMSLRSEM